MKNILLLAAILPILFSCSSSEDLKKTQEENINIIGIWENGDYFISFSPDGYYTAYIEPTFIDAGDYTLNQQNKSIKCKNYYFDRETNIIVSISDNKLTCNFKYINVLGESQNKSISFIRTEESPQNKNNPLIGKTFQALYSSYGKCEWKFLSNDAATFSTIALKPQNRNHFYIYRSPYLYTQHFKPTNAGLSSFYTGSDKGNVYKYTVEFENGNITKLTKNN